MDIFGLDVEVQMLNKSTEPYLVGSEELFYKVGIKETVLLPDCDEAHELAGMWLLNNIPIPVRIMKPTDTIMYDLENYGLQEDGDYRWMPPIYFVPLSGWELLAAHDVFNRQVSVYFRPQSPWRKPLYDSSNRMSVR